MRRDDKMCIFQQNEPGNITVGEIKDLIMNREKFFQRTVSVCLYWYYDETLRAKGK